MTVERNQRKVYQGRVVSDKMEKTQLKSVILLRSWKLVHCQQQNVSV